MKKLLLSIGVVLIWLSSQAQTTTVYFNPGSYQPEADELKKITALVKDFNDKNYASVKVTGYADTTSNWAFNLSLSQKRALRVKKLLIEKGIPESAIVTQHKGESLGGKDLKADRKAEIVLQQNALTLQQIFREQDAEKQYFDVDPLKETEIKCKRGTVLQIPKECFVDEKGEVIKTKINLMVQEYYNLGGYIKKGLFTSCQGKLLSSGGVVNVNVLHKGKQVRFNKDMKMSIGFNSPADEGMEAFPALTSEVGGNVSGWFQDILSKTPGKKSYAGAIWVKDSVLMQETTEKGKVIDTTSKSFRTYRFYERKVPTVYVNYFGFINCDKFVDDPTAVEMEISVMLSSLQQEPETQVYIIFQKTMSVLPLGRVTGDDGKTAFKTPRMKMPYGSVAHLVAVSKTGEKFYAGTDAITLSGNKTVPVSIGKSSLEEITMIMDRYAMN